MDGYVFRYRKESHPRAKANFLSAITFSWILPLFYKGAMQCLDATDLYEPLTANKSKTQGDLMEKAWTAEVERARRKGGKPSYFRALWSVYRKQLVCQGLLIFILEFAVRLSQPLLLGGIISNVNKTEKKNTIATYAYAGGMIGSTLITALIMHSYHMGIVLTGMNMRIGTCSLIYRKVLTMKGGGKGMKGRVLNLMANDALRFDYAVTCLHDLWIAPIQIVLVTYFLYRIVGLAAFVGTATLFACAPLQVWMGKMTSFLRDQTAAKSDDRINLMGEVIGGIHVIKTHAWENHISRLIKKARLAELNLIKRMAVVRGIMTSFQMYHTRCASALTILAYILFGYGALSAYTVFMLTAFFGVLGTTVGVFFPTGILLVSECITSVKRVEDFLLQIEQPQMKSSGHAVVLRPGEIPSQNNDVIVENITSKWPTIDEPVLQNVSLQASRGQLTVILGSVGSGKTSLLHSILGELELTNGSIKAPKKISYVPQEPWLFPGAIRKNILFGETFDQRKYQSVVKMTALLPDMDALKWGDWTKVGERGVSLSGGQKARVNLARGVYKDADVYLLDDPLSAVDGVVQSHLFEQCIRPLSRRKTVFLVTHSLKHLRKEDHVIILENGKVKHDGSILDVDPVELLESRLTDHVETVKDDPVEISLRIDEMNHAATNIHSSKTSSAEQLSTDREKTKSSLKLYFTASGCAATIALISFIIAQTFGSASDYWVSFWVNLEEENYNATGFTEEVVKRVPFKIDRQFCLWVFGSLILGTLIISIIRSLIYFFMCIRASRILHKNMFSSVISAKMNFYYTTKSGSILSRFSKDQGTVDEHFPITFMDFLQIGLSAIGILLVIAVANYWLIFPTIVILLGFYGLRQVYVRTTKGLREIEGQARSPLFTHVGSTLDGLVTIHSREAQAMVADQFDSLQDFHTSAWYLYLAANRAFAFWLDIFCVIYNAIVTIFVLFPDDIVVADVGLAITQCSGLAYTMEWGLRQSAEVENCLVSIRRLHEYSNLDREAPYKSDRGLQAVEGWPGRGAIDFIDVYMRYNKNTPWVLKGLSFSINPGQKVGIVGRTGSGKSSIALTLFRLVDYEGIIKIDGVDIGILGLHDFRPKITVIPQDPNLFAGTVRSNLDPLGEYGDIEIWDALRKVEMMDFVKEQPGGLSMAVSERGGNISTGQKQLLCLARGLLRSNKIVVLDEATANVDEKTEEIIQRAIKINFEDATVITIAHRLRTIIDSDIIMVVDSGRIKQSGPPQQLLEDVTGPFYSLMREANASLFFNG